MEKKDERPGPILSAVMSLSMLGCWLGGYLVTKDITLDDIFSTEKQRAHEVFVLLEQYNKSPCPVPSHCIINVWSH